jgi:hypothetical protein
MALDWQALARRAVLSGQAFIEDGGLVWLRESVTLGGETIDLSRLASLAECGHCSCACTRRVRAIFGEQVVRRVSAAHQRGELPGSLSYISIGSGLLLGDMDVIMRLQEAGFEIASATFIDSDYDGDACHGALAAMAEYLAPRAKLTAFASMASYALARLACAEGDALQLTGHVFVQIDVAEVGFDEAAALSALALEPAGYGFRLVNQDGACATIDAWRRSPAVPPPSIQCALDELRADALRCRREREQPPAEEAAHERGRPPHRAAAGQQAVYAQMLERLDPRPLLLVELDDAVVNGGERGPPLSPPPSGR